MLVSLLQTRLGAVPAASLICRDPYPWILMLPNNARQINAARSLEVEDFPLNSAPLRASDTTQEWVPEMIGRPHIDRAALRMRLRQ